MLVNILTCLFRLFCSYHNGGYLTTIAKYSFEIAFLHTHIHILGLTY